MAYISSNNNRFYVAVELAYGTVAAITAQNRIPAVKLAARQKLDSPARKDKTGSRTFAGNPSGQRRVTDFELTTYMTGWANQTQEPPHGPLFHACLGSSVTLSNGGTVATVPNATTIQFNAPHGLVPGQAVTSGNDIRFVTAIVDTQTIQVNAPFTVTPTVGSVTTPTATYQTATDLPSASVFDYWSPGTAVHRVFCGSAASKLQVKLNSDYHEFVFSGQACDVVDSASFQSGQGALTSFPVEPVVGPINYSIIPGHLGQVWLGATPNQFLTLTAAHLTVDNSIDLRAREFGSLLPRAISPGSRAVTLDFSLFQLDDTATASLYQAARQRSPMTVMLQLGQQQGQLFGIYLKSVIPEVPAYDDSQTRLQWSFQSSRAQGGVNDEIYVAFG